MRAASAWAQLTAERAQWEKEKRRLNGALDGLLKEHERSLRAFVDIDELLERGGFKPTAPLRQFARDGIAVTRAVLAKARGDL